MTIASTLPRISPRPDARTSPAQPGGAPLAPFSRRGLLTALVLVAGFGVPPATARQTTPGATAHASRPASKATGREEVDMLIKAIDQNDEQLFNYLLKQGADVNGTGSKGWTPLGFAAHEGQLSFVRRLLDRGAQVNQPANSRRIPLLAAASEGHAEVVKLLIDRGAAPDAQAENRTALSLAAHEGHVEVVRYLLAGNAKSAKALADGDKSNPLAEAAAEGHAAVVALLLEKADPATRAILATAALPRAAREGHLSVVRLLLDNGARPDQAGDREDSPLVAAAREGRLNVVELLFGKTDGAAKAELGSRALGAAAREGRLDVVRFLLAKDVQAKATGGEGHDPLEQAAREGHADMVALLLEKGDKAARADRATRALAGAAREGRADVVRLLLDSGARLEKAGDREDSPFVAAAREGRLEVVELLHGKLDNAAKDDQGKRALLAAAREGRQPVVEWLVRKGVPVNAVTDEARTALTEAAREGRDPVVAFLLANGAEVNKADGKGRTPLHAASAEGRTQVVQRLIGAGASVAAVATGEWTNMNFYNDFGHGFRVTLANWTPLLFAVSEKRVETVKVLLAAGAAVNARSSKTVQPVEVQGRNTEPVAKGTLLVATGWTPLMEAAERESVPLVRLLLAGGADKNARTEEGITAAGVAGKTGNREIMELLK